jgi:hypothetical protein
MSASVAAPPDTVRGLRPSVVWPALAATEIRRLVLHPVFLGGLAFVAIAGGLEGAPGPRVAYSLVTGAVVFFVGPFAFFAANLLASRDRRSRADEWLASLPAGRRSGTAAALAACAGPAAIAAVATSVLLTTFTLTDRLPQTPPVLELLTVPLTVLGGGLLGVMVARWAPWPGAAALVMVGLVAFHVRLAGEWVLLGAYVEFARWGATSAEWAGVIDGSRGWHAVYLVALCAMAAVGALLVDSHRRMPLFLLGVVATAVAVLAGWAQLP